MGDPLVDGLTGLQAPEDWQYRQNKFNGEESVTTGLIPEVSTDDELLEQFNYDPEKYMIVGSVNQWRKQQPDGGWLTSYFFKVKLRELSLELPTLFAAAKAKKRKPVTYVAKTRTLVVCFADLQIGKTGHRGGTPELLERIEELKPRLEREIKLRKPEHIVFIEAGDLFENFESGGNPMFTNDLSLSQQMDMAGTILFDFISLCALYAPVTILAVTSNHTSWRKGKLELGRPQDDLGLFVHKQVSKQTLAAGIDATWIVPADYSDSVIFDVYGTRLGVTHGHKAGSQKNVVNWWMKQQHGGQPIGSADVLIHGHWHHFTYEPTGRNPYTGIARRVIGLPTLDNGSDWYRATSGDDSDPGMLIFEVDPEHGFDLRSLDII